MYIKSSKLFQEVHGISHSVYDTAPWSNIPVSSGSLFPSSLLPFFSPPRCVPLKLSHTPSPGFTVMGSPLGASVDMILSSHCPEWDASLCGAHQKGSGAWKPAWTLLSSPLATEEGAYFSCISMPFLPHRALWGDLGRPPPRGSTLSSSPTHRASHFQICTKALANRAVTLSCEAGIIFHILHLKKLRLSKAKCLAQGYTTGKDRNQAPLYLAL